MLRTTGRLRRLIAGTLCAAAASALAGAAGRAAEPLRPYDVEPGNVTVSGISSGAYMAAQLHVAFSASVAGAGVVAGGPFYCSENSAILAQSRCMATLTGAPDAERLAEIARAAARAGTTDPLENLTRGRVYIARGSEDPIVRRPVIDALRQFYLLAGVRPENVKVDTSVPAGHAFLTTSFGSDCDDTKPPFINDCDHDQAGAVLGHLLGDLERIAAQFAGA